MKQCKIIEKTKEQCREIRNVDEKEIQLNKHRPSNRANVGTKDHRNKIKLF